MFPGMGSQLLSLCPWASDQVFSRNPLFFLDPWGCGNSQLALPHSPSSSDEEVSGQAESSWQEAEPENKMFAVQEGPHSHG